MVEFKNVRVVASRAVKGVPVSVQVTSAIDGPTCAKVSVSKDSPDTPSISNPVPTAEIVGEPLFVV